MLRDADGREVALVDFPDTMVVLNFVYASCPDVCPLHAEKIAEVQAMINRTPVKDAIAFVSVTTDPANDTADVLKAYGPAHGLDAANRSFLTTRQDQPEDTTRRPAAAFGHRFATTDEGTQTHGVVTHVIDRDGRWGGNFHGLGLAPADMVMYVKGLVNDTDAPVEEAEPGWWARLQPVS